MCGKSWLRKPVVELIFQEYSRNKAWCRHQCWSNQTVSNDLIVWADAIFAREEADKNNMIRKFKEQQKGKKLIV